MQLAGMQLVSKVCIIKSTLSEQKQVKECTNLFIFKCQGKVIKVWNYVLNIYRIKY